MNAAVARVRSLNPLVHVEALSDPSLMQAESLERLIERVDLVCAADLDRGALVGSHGDHTVH